MIEKALTLTNKLGLHARAAAKLVQLNEQFQSSITIIKDEVEANGKSILNVLLLAAPAGTTLTFRVDGQDEQEAIQAIEKLVADRFQEDE